MKKEKMTTVTIPASTLDKIDVMAKHDRRAKGAFIANLIDERYRRLKMQVGFKGVEND